jgi:hypothetical protein
MDGLQLELNNKTFVLKFGMKVLRLLSAKWNVPGLNEVIQKLTVFENMTDNLTFEQIDVINDIILCAIEANTDNTETLTADELDELYLLDMPTMTNAIELVFKAFMDSMPKAEGKQKAPSKAGANKK